MPPAASRSLRRATVIAVALAFVTLATNCSPSSSSPDGTAFSQGPPEGSRPHLFLITADALRADHLSLSGYSRLTSPHLDRLAKNGWHFENAVTVIPKTGPSFATIFSGRPPLEHGIIGNFQRIPFEVRLLAERLRGSGYSAAAFVSNPVLKPNRGYDRGFAPYEMFSGEDAMDGVVYAFEQWANEHDWSQPTLVWLHFIDPHGPYTPSGEFAGLFRDDLFESDHRRIPLLAPEQIQDDRKGKRRNQVLGTVPPYQRLAREDRVAEFIRRYDAEIRAMDAQVGAVLEYLDQRRLTDDSVVTFLSDHGESLGEHDYYFEHGWFAYEPTLAIPLIIRLPGQTEGGVVSSHVSTLHLLPTYLALAGIDQETSEGLLDPLFGQAEDGSWQPAVQEGVTPIQNAGFFPVRWFGLRTPRFKYLRNPDTGEERLYDLETDPEELVNLSAEPGRAEMLSEFRSLHTEIARLARQRAAGEPETVTDDARLRKELEALGYVGGN